VDFKEGRRRRRRRWEEDRKGRGVECTILLMKRSKERMRREEKRGGI